MKRRKEKRKRREEKEEERKKRESGSHGAGDEVIRHGLLFWAEGQRAASDWPAAHRYPTSPQGL